MNTTNIIPKDIPIIKTFQTNNKFYFYDTYTNNIFETTKEQYKEILILKTIGITEYKKNKKSTRAYNEILMLLNKGLMRSEFINKIQHCSTKHIKDLLKNNVNDITLQVTKDCNFKCRYCLFANNNNIYRNHEGIYMSWDIAKKSIDFLYNHSSNSQTIEISFYGGEPMLNFNLIKKTVDYVNNLFYSKKITYRITTNGSILSDEMMTFITQNNFKIAISIDGPPNIQNKHRLFKETGKETYSTVAKNIIKLKENFTNYFNKNVSFMPVVFDDEKYEDIVKHFTSFFNIDNDKIIQLSADLSGIDYMHSMIQLNKNKFINTHNKSALYNKEEMDNIYYDKNPLPCIWHHNGPCIPGVKRLFINTEGIFYTCEKSVENINFSIGSVHNGFNEDKIIEYLNIGQITEQYCKGCWAMRFCKICFAECIDIENNTISQEIKIQGCKNRCQAVLNYLKEICNNT